MRAQQYSGDSLSELAPDRVVLTFVDPHIVPTYILRVGRDPRFLHILCGPPYTKRSWRLPVRPFSGMTSEVQLAELVELGYDL